MAASTKADIIVDYLVVGAGVSGLSFVDELLTRTSATVLIVDKRDQPGGHWNDSYPYVKLHQPASQYGVESKELASSNIDVHGLNKGLSTLASGPEIISYCTTVMRDRFLPSGRVTFFPSTELLPDGTLREGPSGKIWTVQINKKLVDAAYYSNVIPLKHTRSFEVDQVPIIPPNHLPSRAQDAINFTVVGAGKTGIDTCIWLLERGVDPERIRWIMPADYWYYNRAKFQGLLEFFMDTFTTLVDMYEGIGTATTSRDIALALEKCGVWQRLDPSIEPQQFHAATLAPREVEELRRIPDIVRKGHVTKIDAQKITLTNGTVDVKPNTLFIDCTASCLPDKPSVPVFQPGKIVPQMIRYPLIPFSCAKIAFLESLDWSDDEKNKYATPLRYPKNLDGYILSEAINMENRARENQSPILQRWLAQSRLDVYTKLTTAVRPEDMEKLALLGRMQAAFMAAYQNMPKVVESLQSGAVF
ncbi:hypothetical protein M409DRAFT_49119 [Zasmidium cellare ATCC 36951]|uniref:FAD/NAD(P)-binding domain-containing protein n=1 Tax=Zasmidium cellare ATCC 36951 TaxID=1080233 RepID=A0A6A6D4B3_ZASCE|nr:uncharacterized protein M409DRAFT_49119 [Zasmidium cellare ATCC 36951]KAF2174261.1 hypothetical protein M409DRAFT_49119 [Zasmidium cellare ATCC 36951]